MYHDGACSEPHGHSYTLEIHIISDELVEAGPKKNMVVDFHQISDVVNPMIETYLDHKWLNDTLETDSPTSEFIARWVYRKLKNKLPGLNLVSVSETTTSQAIYSES